MAGLKKSMIPEKNDAILVVVDIQDKMATVMEESALSTVLKNSVILIKAAREMNIPIIVTEQYPKGLGKTVESVRHALEVYEPVEKLSFSCCREQKFMDVLKTAGRRQVILCGMETHVCLYQTALDLLNDEYFPFLISDAVCSRRKSNWRYALQAMRHAGVSVISTEMAVFQLLEVAGTPQFKAVSSLIK